MKILFRKMIVVFVLAIILLTTVSVVNAQVRLDTGTGATCSGLICCANPPNCNFQDFMQTVGNIVYKLLQLSLAFVAIIFAYAGYEYLTSQGDSGKRSHAHGMLTKAGIGLIIVLTAFLIVELITSTLGLDVGIIRLIK